MPNIITVYLGVLGAIGAIELEVPGLNDLFPINANIASNSSGRRVEPGEYILDSIAYTPKTPEVQNAYGEAIIRFIGENRIKLAIFGGETAPDGSLAPTEGGSIRVDNDALSAIVNFIEGSGSGTTLIVTDDEPGMINSIRINRWYGRPANIGRIALIRPGRFRGEEVDHSFYTNSGMDDYGLGDWLIWELLYNLGFEAASQTDFYQTYDESWIGYEDSSYDDDESPYDSERQEEEAPYIADPFSDTEQQNMTFENQIESSQIESSQIESSQIESSYDADSGPGDTTDSGNVDDSPDNNY
jgi:hypothetical protein